ncbi:MAG TPA: endonuclease/exonuclease/phosphatase family protein [Pyrinomonadaceae bacterium]|nr:endonuclease/exonuclease/phosphatase family protein [Pyrinomonadaceae bacterium]
MSWQVTLILILISTTLAPRTALHVNNDGVDNSALLEVGSAPPNTLSSKSVPALKIVSYNIRWRSGDQLQEIIQLLKTDSEIGGAAILGLQEVDRNKKRTANTNTAKLMAEQLGKHYAWAAPPIAKAGEEEETGVAILSSYPLTDVHRIVLPNPGPGGRRRVAVGATALIAGRPLRVYSIHAETRISVAKKLDQFDSVFQDLSRYPLDMPAIVLGDFNTWEPASLEKTTRLFLKRNFATPFPNDRETFLRRILGVPFSLKLDWIWLRGLRATGYGIGEKICVSDHWPLWTTLEMPSQESSKGQVHPVVQ